MFTLNILSYYLKNIMRTLENLLSESQLATSVEAGLRRISVCSPFATRLLLNDGELLQDLLQNHMKVYAIAQMQQFLNAADIHDETSLKKALRQLRQRVLVRTIYRDLNGLADLSEVLSTTTQLAEVTLNHALRVLHAQLVQTYGEPVSSTGEPQGLIVVGMGKLGGGELNVSSDIDLIFAYEQEGETNGAHSISNQDFFTQLAKKLISAIDEVTADGFVFRVDMRLRPFGSEGVLVSNLDALEDYYQNSGREWERYAWIKGRVINQQEGLHGQSAVQTSVEKLLKPFVFRKYLDYNALASMRDLKLQIHRDVMVKKQEDNIKLGRGGIREIEFIAQVFQLIRGGQDASLQIKPTLRVLALLQDKGLLHENTVRELTQAYVFLRNLEHRLMYVEDQQTQDLPKTEEAKTRIAHAMHFADWPTFLSQLNQHRDLVAQHFNATFGDKQARLATAEREAGGVERSFAPIWQGLVENEHALKSLLDEGYSDAAQTLSRLQLLRSSTRYQQLPDLSRQRFDLLMPLVVAQSAIQAQPDETLLRMINLLENICRRASYLALLAEFPDALNLVIKLCAASPWLAQYLAAHPILLDELLDTQTLYAAPDFVKINKNLMQKMQDLQGNIEAQMDAMRHFKHSAVLRLATQDVMGQLPLEILSDYLSALADVILQVSVQTIWQDLKFKHQDYPQFAIIGYGKLGSKELGYLSDLDIIFIYDDAAPQAGEIYARFAQRINSWFNSLTNAGLLYETDLQLRPDGNSGLLVSSIEAFRDYQLHKAWVWEHQAMTRARFVAGDAKIGAHFEQIRSTLLQQTRDKKQLQHDVVSMRDKMRMMHPDKPNRFDVKQSKGGIIDVEFIVQFLVLAHANKFPQLVENIGNIALMERFYTLGIVDKQTAENVIKAYRHYRYLQHRLKLQASSDTSVAFSSVEAHANAVSMMWNIIFDI
jgi:[glutamine synthetase] adenylyltransferase / [glutamine synthetase]-adenylyl-L-tyrosine phosphorylase